VNCELVAELTEQTHIGIGKRKKTEQTKGREGYRKTEFGQDAAISVEEEAIFVQSCKSRTHDLDLEHSLDARSPRDHRVQVWSQSIQLSHRRSELRKMFADRQTDRQTDRRQIPRHCISYKKLSYRRETARQLPMWRGLWPSSPLPSAPSGYAYAYGRIRKPQRTYVKRAVH